MLPEPPKLLIAKHYGAPPSDFLVMTYDQELETVTGPNFDLTSWQVQWNDFTNDEHTGWILGTDVTVRYTQLAPNVAPDTVSYDGLSEQVVSAATGAKGLAFTDFPITP